MIRNTFQHFSFSIFIIIMAGLVGWLVAIQHYSLVLIPIIFFGLVILRKPFWGLLLFIFLIPLESSFLSIGNGDITITRIVGLYVFFVWLINKISNRSKIIFSNNFIIALVFVIWGSLSVIWAYSASNTYGRILTAIQLLILVLLIINMVKKPKHVKEILISLFLGCLIVSFLGAFGIGVESNSYLLTLQNQGAKEYGLYVGIIFIIGSLLFIFNDSRYKWLGFVCSILSIIPLMQVNQRGIFLAIGLTWLAIALITRQKTKPILFILFLIILMVFLPSLLLKANMINSYNADRLTIENLIETGGTGRINIWGAGLRMIADNFIIGVGWGNFPIMFYKYASSMELISSNLELNGRDPHADIIGITGELGLIGLFIFIILFLKILSQNIEIFRKINNKSHKFLVLMIISLLIYIFSAGLTTTFIWRKIYWIILGVSMITQIYLPKKIDDNNVPD